MERHRCQLCSRKFSNGRALGGHMRSHMMTLRIPPKQALAPLPPARSLSFQNEYVSESETLSSPSSPFSTSEEILVDEVVFEPTLPSSLISLRDRESETECFKKSKTNNPTRNRRFSSTSSDHPHHHCRTNDNDEADPPGRSSISDVTSDEDLAFFLMMLSRDKWSGTSSSTRTTVIRKFRCHTCNKSFKSYQALGGHRASHKKIRLDHEKEEDLVAKKVHECPFCFRVFSSGQALGGHKRSHFLLDAAHGGSTGISSSLKKVISDVHESIIDLNLPAPAADEDDSAVSDVHLISDQF